MMTGSGITYFSVGQELLISAFSQPSESCRDPRRCPSAFLRRSSCLHITEQLYSYTRSSLDQPATLYTLWKDPRKCV